MAGRRSSPAAAIWSACVYLLVCASTTLAKHAEDYFVSSLPGAPEPLLRMHAGHIEVLPDHHGNLFFWNFANRHIADRPRTVIWLNGGPGCSSMDGALMEVGPYRVEPDGTLSLNKGGWDEFANLLFVDQPVGTGFSYVDTDSYASELTEIAAQFVVFLEKYFAIFPDQAKDDIYIGGESYAGQHIPYIASAIVDRNKDAAEKWNLTGLLIGNGWISNKDQYTSTIQFAYQHGVIKAGTEDAKRIERQSATCLEDLNSGAIDHPDSEACEGILREVLKASTRDPKRNGNCVNMYDVRLEDEYPSCGMSWPPDLKQVTPYLRRKDVIEALHINPDKKTGWVECSGSVSAALLNRKSKPSATLFPKLLAEMPITLFSGDQDIICNHLGTEEFIANLEYNDGKGLEVSPGVWAPRLEWTFEDEPAGYYQSARNLTYLLFYNASHMVPFDFPRRTRDMVDRFMGVDIGSIGGEPTDSRIDGQRSGKQTSHAAAAAVEAEESRVSEATHHAYYKSGQVALMVVLICAGVWGWVVWRGRIKRRGMGHGGGAYTGLGFAANGKGRAHGDVEAADFDEAELDELTGDGDGAGGTRHGRTAEPGEFDVGFDSDDEHDDLGRESAHHRDTGRDGKA